MATNQDSARKLMKEKCRENLAAGAKLLFARRFEEALSKFQKVLVFDPQNANAFALKSKCYLQMCDLKSAIANLKKAVELDPEEVDWNKQLSILIDAQGLNLLDQVRSKVAGWQNLIQRAIEFFNKAIEADSGEPYFWLHRAIAFTLCKDYRFAVSDLERYVSIDADNCEVFIMLAKLHWRLNNQHAGHHNLVRAHEIDPGHPEVQILMRSVAKRNQVVYQRTARTFLNNDVEATVEELDRALQVSPSNVNMLLLRAAAHRKLGKLQESLADIQRAKDVYTRSVMEHRRSMVVKSDGGGVGGPKAGFSQVEELCEIVVQRNQTLNEMALKEMRAGHVRAAWSIFNQVVEADVKLSQRNPKYKQTPAFLLNRGDSQREAKNWPQAFEDYIAALKLDPDSVATKSRISLVYNEFAVTQFNLKHYQKVRGGTLTHAFHVSPPRLILPCPLSSSCVHDSCTSVVLNRRQVVAFVGSLSYRRASACGCPTPCVQAALLYTKAIEMYPQSAHLYLSRAKAYFYDSRLRPAYEDLQVAVAKDPNNAEAAERLQHLTATFRVAGEGNVATGGGGGGSGGGGGGGGAGVSQPRRAYSADAAAAGKQVRFPAVVQKDNIAIKLLPGRATTRHPLVPQSFGSGFQVMPKTETHHHKQNSLRTTRPLP
jgi:tetratricopeptide (TPR) repeat protein